MKQKYNLNLLEVFCIFVLGGVLTWTASVVWNEVDYHAKCDGAVVSDSWGKNYCIDPELLEGAQP
jgi:hypothetical protein